MNMQEYDLVVLGVPLPTPGARISLNGVVGQALEKITSCSMLVVRSHYYRGQVDPITGAKR